MRLILPISFVVFLLIPFFLPHAIELSHDVTIKEEQTHIYSFLMQTEAWSPWSLWMLGPNQNDIQFTGVPGVVGSMIVGHGPGDLTGSIRLIELLEPKSIHLESDAGGFWPTQLLVQVDLAASSADHTRLTMSISAPLSYPLERYMALFRKNELQALLEEGLKQLKMIVEKERKLRLRETTAFTDTTSQDISGVQLKSIGEYNGKGKTN